MRPPTLRPPTLLMALLMPALSACDRSPTPQPAQPITVRSDNQDRLHTLDEMGRAIALKRALLDSKAECRRVVKSGYVGDYKNMDYWTATCEDKAGRTRDWALFVGADESVQVRLCDDVAEVGLPECKVSEAGKATPAG